MKKPKSENRRNFNPDMTYVMKHRDRVEFVRYLTPMTNHKDVTKALPFKGDWLNDSCWSWQIFYEPMEQKAASEQFTVKPIKTKKRK